MYLRNKCYDWNLFASTRFQLPIISVGNLSVGGTGKTPHTEYIVRLLQDDFKTATLSRGYKRSTKGFYLANDHTTVDEIGDEPLQYHLKFKKTTVAVAEKRVYGVHQILKQCPKTEVIVLDDAFQHRAILPGFNILITAYSNLYINDTVMPAGRLREWKTGSKRADIIIVAKTLPDMSLAEQTVIQSQLQPKAHQKVFFSYIRYGSLVAFTKTAQQLTAAKKNDTAVLLLTGIANPTPLVGFLQRQYATIQHLPYKDHYNFSEVDVQRVQQQFETLSSSNKIVITTEKDAMRLSLPHILDALQQLPVFYVPIEVCFHGNGQKAFDKQLLSYVRKTLH